MTSERETTLLVVDDEAANLESLEKIFQKEGFRVLTATGGREALDLCRTHRVHVVLSDLMMPGMSGMELFAEIKRDYPDQALRMGFINGGIYTDDAQRFVDERPDRLLFKPFGPRELRRFVDEVAFQGEELSDTVEEP